MAALAQEVARSTPELKAAFEQGFENILSAQGGDRKEAIFQAAAMIGGVVLARAVQDHATLRRNSRERSTKAQLIVPSRIRTIASPPHGWWANPKISRHGFGEIDR